MKFKSILSALLFAFACNLGAMDEKQLQQELNQKMKQLNESMQEYQNKLNIKLLEAVAKKNIKKISWLIKNGADINAKSSFGETPLICAANIGNTEAVQLLLADPNINVNQADNYKTTALSRAVKHTKVVQLLLNHHNIDPNAGNPLTAAALAKKFKTIQLLLNHPNINVNKTNDAGRTAFWIAACKGNIKIVQTLLTHPKIDVNKTDKITTTPLWVAACNGNTKIVQTLLAHPNININQANQYGDSPLFIATHNCHKKIAFLLLNKGAIVDNTTEQELLKHLTPLQIAVAQGNIKKVTSLLKNQTVTNKLLEIPAICSDVHMMYFLLQFNPSKEAIKHAYLKIKNKTDNKSMMIKTMLGYWLNMQDKPELRAKFNDVMLYFASEYGQQDLFLLDQEPSKAKEYIIEHIARTFGSKNTTEKLSNK